MYGVVTSDNRVYYFRVHGQRSDTRCRIFVAHNRSGEKDRRRLQGSQGAVVKELSASLSVLTPDYSRQTRARQRKTGRGTAARKVEFSFKLNEIVEVSCFRRTDGNTA